MLARKLAVWKKISAPRRRGPLGLGGELADLLAAAVSERHAREAGTEVVAETADEGGERWTHRAVAAVLRLQRDAEPIWSGGTEERFSASLGDPARQRLHQLGIGLAGAADELRPGPHRPGDPFASLSGCESREHEGDPLQRQCEANHAAAVDAGFQLAGVDLRGRGDLRQDLVLERMAGQTVALGRPAAGPAGRQHARMLAGAVVVDRLGRSAFLETDLEVVLGRRRSREQSPDGIDLLGLCSMGGRG